MEDGVAEAQNEGRSGVEGYSIKQLIAMPKRVDAEKVEYDAPAPGSKIEVRLMSPEDLSRKFTLSIAEGARSSQVTLAIEADRKTSFQTRHLTIPLVRVDIDEKAVHTNPDGTVLRGSHVHIATDEYGDRMAYPIRSAQGIMVAGKREEIPAVFEVFREYCNIDRSLLINWTLGI